jgi:hypothetical protein
MAHSPLILFPEGHIVCVAPGQGDEPRFAAWETAEFEAFLRKVPLPTWWERTQDTRDRWKAYVIIYVLVVALGWLFAYGVASLPRFLGLRH